MSDLLKNPTLASNLIALRSKTLPAHERKALALTVLEQMRDIVNEASDLIHELHLPDGLSSVLWQGVEQIDSHLGTTVGSLVETVDRSLYTLDNLLWAMGTSNSLWLRERGTTYDRASNRREAARAAADSPFQGADAAEFGPKIDPLSGLACPECGSSSYLTRITTGSEAGCIRCHKCDQTFPRIPAASHTLDFRREAENCGGDLRAEYPDPTVERQGVAS